MGQWFIKILPSEKVLNSSGLRVNAKNESGAQELKKRGDLPIF
jgi:hypothetical protein